jgi:hypothetical protein
LASEYVISPFDDFRTKAAREWRDETLHSGANITSQDDMDVALDIAATVLAREEMPNDCSTEVAVFGEINGIPVKGMIDIVPEFGNALYDLKTINKIESLDALQRTILNYGYHWQAALYLDLWNTVTGANLEEFVFVFVETSAPYETAFIKIGRDLLDLGRYGAGAKSPGYMDAINLWEKCVNSNTFPQQIEGIQTIGVPPWVKFSDKANQV